MRYHQLSSGYDPDHGATRWASALLLTVATIALQLSSDLHPVSSVEPGDGGSPVSHRRSELGERPVDNRSLGLLPHQVTGELRQIACFYNVPPFYLTSYQWRDRSSTIKSQAAGGVATAHCIGIYVSSASNFPLSSTFSSLANFNK